MSVRATPMGTLRALFAARCAAYAFMVSMPWACVFLGPVNPHDGARIFETIVMYMAAGALIASNARWGPGSSSGTALFSTLLLLGLLSVVASERWTYAALEFSAVVMLAAVAAVFAQTSADALQRELPPVLALATLMSVVMELPRWLFFLSDARIPQAADFGFMYMSHRFFNHAQSLMLPLGFIPLLVPTARWARLAAWIGVVGGLALVWRTGGRGTLLALLVFVVSLPWLMRANVREVARVLALAFAGAALVYWAFFLLPAPLLGLAPDHRGHASIRLIEGDDSGRFYLWKLALDDMVRHPWLGIGPMHYAHQPNLLAAHPHNSVAQLAAEWGLPAAACALAAVGLLLVCGTARSRDARSASEHRTRAAVATLATLAGGIDSLVSGTLVMPVSQLWWFVALGCMLAGPVEPQPPPDRGATRWLRAGLLAAALGLHLTLSVVSYQRSLQAPDPDAAQRTNVPRYWYNGFF